MPEVLSRRSLMIAYAERRSSRTCLVAATRAYHLLESFNVRR